MNYNLTLKYISLLSGRIVAWNQCSRQDKSSEMIFLTTSIIY